MAPLRRLLNNSVSRQRSCVTMTTDYESTGVKISGITQSNYPSFFLTMMFTPGAVTCLNKDISCLPVAKGANEFFTVHFAIKP